ncbi:hypothetical protein C8Q70DRAFT_684326 [Cubamyces menziesii]|uniref:Transmembrane protein n=1 Tax=Trametes cubensis TaxID=1111947 RepID=A0AAD7TMZ6_9APHY|nr:hypothetical protein C8Q70DRAFT_684326 [Cubamyces menziesii]KAJ8472344.1 hypothetical protein ONZ51_g8575 [Trametes cubensis]
MSQESLPMYYEPEPPYYEPPKGSALQRATRVFLVLGTPGAPSEYFPVPVHDPNEDLEKGPTLVATIEVGAVADAPEGPTSSVAPSARSKSLSAGRAICNAVWYLRMCLLLAIVGAGVSFACSFISYFLGMITFLAWRAPFSQLDVKTALTACAIGSPLVGATVGFIGFLAMCARRARMSAEKRAKMEEYAARERAGEWLPVDEWREYVAEPVEILAVGIGAAFCSGISMLLGMALVPGLAAIAHEVGFGFGHAALLGLWGTMVPFIPHFIGAVFGTLWDCDPVGGWNGGFTFWSACCTPRN